MANKDVLIGTNEQGTSYYIRYEVVDTVDGKDVLAPVVSATVEPPAGGATEAEQETQTTHLAAIETAVEGATPAGTNTIGGAIPTATAAANGASLFRSIDLDETEEEVKATAGQVYGVVFSNTATSSRFLKLYNATAADVTVGTTTPVLTLALPGNASDDVSGVIAFPVGVVFSTAITAAATTGVADNDTGAPGANEVIVNILFK